MMKQVDKHINISYDKHTDSWALRFSPKTHYFTNVRELYLFMDKLCREVILAISDDVLIKRRFRAYRGKKHG